MAGEVSCSDVGQLYLELHQRLHRLVDEAMAEKGLSLSRAKVLMQLDTHGPMNQTALAARLGFAARSVTDAVDALERAGQAIRTDDPEDRRARIVTITPAGRAQLKKAMSIRSAMFTKIFGALDAPERAQFAELLKTIGRPLAPTGDTPCPQAQ